MHTSWFAFLLAFASVVSLTKGDRNEDCNIPTLIYDDLKCSPKYNSPNEGCPKEYDCSHINNHPPGTCHLRGKFYKSGETPDREVQADRCDHAFCECAEGGAFSCIVPSDSCGEWWVPNFVKPGCYLKYEQNRCCSSGQACPPFDDNVKCEVNGKTYDEGQQFNHPTQKCTKCVCSKGFSGKLEAPFCQQRNCTAELLYSKEIDKHCAPYYRNLGDCCPSSWICHSEIGTYIPASSPPTNTDLKCKFGEKIMYIGEKYEQPNKPRGRVSCECVIPPFLTCTPAPSS